MATFGRAFGNSLAQQGTWLNYSDEYKTVLLAQVQKPDSDLKKIQDAFVKILVDSGIWDKGDMLLVSDNHTNANGEALLNWINPSQSAINHGTTHYPYCGLTPDALSTFVDSGFNPTMVDKKYTQNNSTFLVYSRKRIYDHIGSVKAGGLIAMQQGGQYVASTYNNGTTILVAAGRYDGFIATTRNSAISSNLFLGNIKVTGASNSTALQNQSLYIAGGTNTNAALANKNNGAVSIAFTGSYLTDEQIGIFKTAIDTYINSVDARYKILTAPIAIVNSATKQKLTIPTYVAGNNEVVHPSIVNCGTAWNGYQYWMAITPYANANDDYENPEIYCSSDGLNWIVPVGGVNPVVPAIGTVNYNADPFLFFENGIMYLGWMESTAPQKIWMLKSTDGITWTDKTQLISVSDGFYNSSVGIGSMIKVGATYYLYYYGRGAGSEKAHIMRKSSTSPMGPFLGVSENIDFHTVANLEWYHFSVKYYNGRCYIIAATSPSTSRAAGDFEYIGVSDDGIHFKRNNSPLISKTEAIENKFYMPVFETIGNKLFIYYSIYSSENKWELMTAEMEILQ